MKKKIFLLLLVTFLLTACDVWQTNPQPFPVWTAIPTRTPNVVTATPIILDPGVVVVPPTSTQTPEPTITPTFTPSETPTPALIPALGVDVLGCDTSFDITHGMGEVTNAYVIVKNIGNVDLPNTCAMLRAIDEGRVHPDKKVCVSNLPVRRQVTLKLTVDSTYKQGTIIQVDATSNEVLLLRVDKQSCTDIALFGGAPANLGVVQPIP